MTEHDLTPDEWWYYMPKWKKAAIILWVILAAVLCSVEVVF